MSLQEKNRKVCSITVSRRDSQRVKNKWSKKIGHLSLMENKIQQLKNTKLVDEVCVGTNICEVEEICLNLKVSHFMRDEYYCDESVCSANEMIYDMCKKVEADVILWAHCTNPLISSGIYDHAIKTFFEKEKEGFDSLLSVNVVREHLWTTDKKPMNYNPKSKTHTLASQLNPIYKQDGGIFIQRKNNFLKNSYFFGEKPFLFIVDEKYSTDINTEMDLKIANFLLKLRS